MNIPKISVKHYRYIGKAQIRSPSLIFQAVQFSRLHSLGFQMQFLCIIYQFRCVGCHNPLTCVYYALI